jgi:hypothetical protein
MIPTAIAVIDPTEVKPTGYQLSRTWKNDKPATAKLLLQFTCPYCHQVHTDEEAWSDVPASHNVFEVQAECGAFVSIESPFNRPKP